MKIKYDRAAGLITHVKSWYRDAFPSDEVGADIPDKLTFSDALAALDTGNFYRVIRPADDSVVRERVFAELARRMGISYDRIYDKWIKGVDEK